MGGSLSHGVDTCCEKVSPYQGSHFLTEHRVTGMRSRQGSRRIQGSERTQQSATV